MKRLRPIIDIDYLQRLLEDRSDGAIRGDVILADCRAYLDGRDGRAAWIGGHVPGAVHIDLEHDVTGSGQPADGRHPLPAPSAFAHRLGILGVADDSHVVAYDDVGGAMAARLVWMVRSIGGSAAILDGGLDAWTGELATGVETRTSVGRTVVPWPAALLTTSDDVEQSISAGNLVVDSRANARYRGDHEPIDPRAGHIPGAINRHFADNLDSSGRFDRDRVLARFADVDDSTIVYCGSGVTACHNLLAIEQATGVRARLYVGSWSGWSSEPDRAIAIGDASSTID